MGGHAIYRQNTQVFEMRNFTSAYTKGWTNGQTYLRTQDFVRTKISWKHR